MTQTTEDLAATPDFVTDAFSEVLNIVHVHGETARVVTSDDPSRLSVQRGTPCVYIVEKGEVEILLDGEPPVTLGENQIALLLQGVAHEVVFRPSSHEADEQTINCFWGSFTVDGDLAAQVLRSLPQIIVLEGLSEQPIEWVDTVCELVLRETGATRPGASLMVSRLLDLLLVIILRRWAQSESNLPGWLAAAKDERIARAVSAIHAEPARSLTNAELADIAGMSVSSFAERFKQVMGQQPGAYLRGWRLDQAAEALLHSSATIEAIAERVGYKSNEAFSRAFQAKFGTAPSVWRSSRTGSAS